MRDRRGTSRGGRWLGIVVLAWALSGAVRARAERTVPASRIESPRGMALGSGVRAAAASTQAQAENPAHLVLGGVYHIESFFAYDPTFKRSSVGASVVDSMTSRVAAGLSARGLFGDNDAGENSGWEGRLGLGVPVGDMVSLGLAGRYSNMTVSDTRALPERPVVDGMSVDPDRSFKLKAFTLDAAVSVRPVAGLSIAALGYNLIDTDSPLAPMLVGGSVAFSSQGLTLGGDVLVDLTTFDKAQPLFGGGLEYLLAGVAPLRIGYLFDQGRTVHFISGGLGYVDPRFALQTSVRQSLSQGRETSLFFAISYFVQ